MKKHLLRMLAAVMTLCMIAPASLAAVSYPIDTDVKLTYWLPIQGNAAKHMTSYNDHPIYQQISKNTGIQVEFQNCAPADATTQLGLLVTGDDLPDIMQIRGFYPGGASAGVSEGAFADLTPYIKEYAPDYWKAIRSSDLCWRLSTDAEGRINCFYTIKVTAPAFRRMNVVQEVLDEYGLQVPTTLAEYEACFAKLKESDIAGLRLASSGRESILMWPFGITDGWMLDENGKVAYGMYTQAYKDYLTLMHDWYEKGYIYKDFMTPMTMAENFALLTNKEVFMHADPVDLANSACVAVGLTCNPLPYVRMQEGQSLHFETTYDEFMPEATFATTVVSAKSEHIKEAVMYLNYCYTQEGADLCNYGVKDVTYTVDENGVKHFTDAMLNNPDVPRGEAQMVLKLHTQPKLSDADVLCNPNVVADEYSLMIRKRYGDDPTVDHAQTLPNFPLTAEASEERSDIMNDINTYVDEMTLKFITGVTPLDEFDAYMAQLEKMHIEDAIAVTQAQYDAFMSKPGLE